jgi:hypothetical protein
LKKNIFIIAPHPDDEIIGTYEIIKNHTTMILYDASTSQSRREEAMKLKDNFDITAQAFVASIPPHWYAIDNSVFFFPDPTYEVHPLHRHWGHIGESMARSGRQVIFYNTIMNAPYIHEVDDFSDKRQMLDKIYDSQKKMWEWDEKYFLFEGYNSWHYNFEGIL